jgi:hypothetical protein
VGINVDTFSIFLYRLSNLPQTILPSIWKTEMGEDQNSMAVQVKKIARGLLNGKKQSLVAGTCHPTYNGKHKIGGSGSRFVQKVRPCFQNIRTKRAGGMAQVAGHLPSKCRSLSSNHLSAKKKKKNPNSHILDEYG